MPNTMPVSSVNPKLHNILERCDFLTLLSSHDAIPNSKGTGLPLLQVETPRLSALIALQGAQLLQCGAKNGSPLLWLSPNCEFTPGTPLRGGIPVCLPWFGPNVLDPKKPKHGFARNREWQLIDAMLLDDDSVELMFNFTSHSNELFEYNFSAQLVLTLGEIIKLDIEVTNHDIRDFDCSWVLHSYHPVQSLTEVRVEGLNGKMYLDNLDKHAAKMQQGDVNFLGEVDRVYLGIDNTVVIAGTPRIQISHENCPSVVVWNPAEKAAQCADIGLGNEQGFICVERGAVFTERWHLSAGETKAAVVTIAEIIEGNHHNSRIAADY